MGWDCVLRCRKGTAAGAFVALVATAAFVVPAPAAAAPNDLFFFGCLTADKKIGLYAGGRSRVNGCVRVDSVEDEGANTGLRGLSRPVVSPDGQSVYAAARGDAAVARFFVDRVFVSYRDCITADADVKPGENACKHLDATASGGVDTGLDGLSGAAFSPDGRNVYSGGAADASLLTFGRERPVPPPGEVDQIPPELRVDAFKRRLSGPITFLVGCGEACRIEAVPKLVARFKGKRRKRPLSRIELQVFNPIDELAVDLGPRPQGWPARRCGRAARPRSS